MADYTQPEVVQKRVRFFDGQFLQDQDFIDEQRYHLDRERRQSRLLSVTGIISGLTVTKSGTYQVTVAKGMAVDALGRQLILAADLSLRLSDKFAKKQSIDLHLVYQETATDVAQTGGKSERRWDESPKIAALAPDGTVAVAPDGASSTWEGPTVLLARLAVADNGDVTVNATAAPRAGLSVPGAVGIGTTSPAAKLEVSGGGGTSVDLIVNGRLRSNNNDGGLWVAGDRFVGGHTTDRIGFWNAGEWRLTVLPNGNVGIGTTGPPWKLSVSSSNDHLALYREAGEKKGGAYVFLELAQIDSSPPGVPEVFPCIRFNHHNRFAHRIEGRGSGFHFKIGDPAKNDYSDIRAGNVTATGKLEVSDNVGIGTSDPENSEIWEKVVDILGRWNAKLSLRAKDKGIDSRVMVHDGGMYGAPAGMIVGTKSNHALSFVTNATARLSIAPTGNVGIGTQTPAFPLMVVGDLGVDRGLIRTGRLDYSTAKSGEVLGGIGFIGMGVQHGVLSFRAGFGFELVDQSAGALHLNYKRDSIPYADLKMRNLVANDISGKLSQPCSIAFKEEAETLNDDQLSRLYHDTLRTDVVTFRYKGSALQDRRSLGVIAERCPEYIVDPTGASVNQIEYTAMLHGAVKVLADRVGRLEEALAVDLALLNDRERPDRNRPRPPTPG